MGGQKSLRSYWRNYFESTDGLVWVVDSADKLRMNDCKKELHALLQEEVSAFKSQIADRSAKRCLLDIFLETSWRNTSGIRKQTGHCRRTFFAGNQWCKLVWLRLAFRISLGICTHFRLSFKAAWVGKDRHSSLCHSGLQCSDRWKPRERNWLVSQRYSFENIHAWLTKKGGDYRNWARILNS